MKVVISGGGTAGHVYPALAVADALRAGGAEVIFIGTSRGPESKLASDSGHRFETIDVLGRKKGTFNLHNVKALSKLTIATGRSLHLLAAIAPDVVLTTGGYVSLPVTLAAAIHRMPLVVHEQNSVPGLANRIASRFAAAIGISFPETESRFGARARLVGNPVRPQIASLDRVMARPEGLSEFGLAPGRRTLLIAGGSQGARSINQAALGAYEIWRSDERIQVLHLVGARNVEDTEATLERLRGPDDRVVWRIIEYTDRMDLAYAVADAAVCRAGAMTIAELAAAGVPALLVPFPFAIDDDQTKNAEVAVSTGGAEMILDSALDAGTLAARAEALLFDDTKSKRMTASIRSLFIPDAAGRIVAMLEEIATWVDKPKALLGGIGWRRVHLVGVGGAGMSAIARVLDKAGVEVSGSDLADSVIIQRLQDAGLVIHIGHSPRVVANCDAVIYSSAVPESNVELEAARTKGITTLARGEALARIVESRRVVAISGTHGKTTTSGMISTILEHAGLDPTYLIGADITRLGPGGKLGSGEIAVVEADEAYGSFLALHPHLAVVTNVDTDHLDYYGSIEALEEAFTRFGSQAERIIVCADDARAASIEHPKKTTYGFSEDARVTASEVNMQVDRSEFLLTLEGDAAGRASLGVGGRRNILNALGAAAAAEAMGVPVQAILDALADFKGVSRRFEYRGTVAGADLVDDYAHHPTEIEATLSDARSGPWSRIVAVFQPHLYSRTRVLSRQFGAALGQADLVVVTDIYPAREEPLEGVTGKLVAEATCEADPTKRVAYVPGLDEAAAFVREQLRPGDLVLSLGAGDITTLPDRVLARS